MKALTCIAIVSIALLASCSQEADLVPHPEKPRASAHADPTGRSWLQEFTLGTKLGSNGAIAPGAKESAFEIGQHIYLAMRLRDAPVGAEVRVVWKGPTSDPLGEETKKIRPGQDYLYFAADSGNLIEGRSYSVEVWVGRTSVTQLEFDVISPSSG